MIFDFIRSPLVQASAVFALVFALAFVLLPHAFVNDVLDGFAIAGAMLALYRFGCHARESLTARKPDGPQVLIVSVAGIVLSIGAIRALREFGLELGLLQSAIVGYAFGAITVVMVFSIFLLVIAPPIRHQGHSLNLTPWTALVLALLSGSVLTAVIVAVRAAH
jgi:hypothetical protein